MRDRSDVAAAPYRFLWPLIGLTVLAAALRLYRLDSGLWYDEIKTLIDAVRPPLISIVTAFASDNDHRFYSVLAHLSIAAFGEHPWSLRLPAALFGIATVPLLYHFGTSVAGRLEAFAAAALLAVSYHHVWFSQNARGYTLLLFATVLATHLLLQGLRQGHRAAFIGYAVVTAFGTYTHLTMALVTASHALIVAVRVFGKRGVGAPAGDWVNPLIGFGLAALLTGALYAPVLLDVRTVVAPDPGEGQLATTGWAILETLRQLRIGFAMGAGALLGSVLLLAGCWSYFRSNPTVLALFVLPGPVTLAAAVLLERPVRPRLFFLLAGFGILIVVRGALAFGTWVGEAFARFRFARPAGRLISVVTVVGMILFSAMALPYGYRHPKQDYRRALVWVESAANGQDVIAVVGGGTAVPYQRYYGKSWPAVHSVAGLDTLRAGPGRVWLIYTFPHYIEAGQPDLMDRINNACEPGPTFPGTVATGDIRIRRCDPF